ASLQPPQLHKIPWDAKNTYCDLFVDGKGINIYLSPDEEKEAEEILTIDERQKLAVIKLGFDSGWNQGLHDADKGMTVGGNPAELLERNPPLSVPERYQDIWKACWKHGYSAVFRRS